MSHFSDSYGGGVIHPIAARAAGCLRVCRFRWYDKGLVEQGEAHVPKAFDATVKDLADQGPRDFMMIEAAPNQADRLLTAAFVLTGLRLPRTVAFELFQGVRSMRDSDTYGVRP